MLDITLMPRPVMMMVAVVVRPGPNRKYSRLLLLVFKLDYNYCCYYSCSTSETMGHLRSPARHQMLFLKAPRHLTVTIVCAGLALTGMMRPNR